MKKFDDEDGVWRTVGGRRIFIRNGESLSSAMKRSGKFKKDNKKDEKLKENRDEIKTNNNDLRKKYFGSNLNLYNQDEEVIKEINSKDFASVKNFKELIDDYENNENSDYYADVIKLAQERIAVRKENEIREFEKKRYIENKKQLAKLRKEHSVNLSAIEYYYEEIKKYENKYK